MAVAESTEKKQKTHPIHLVHRIGISVLGLFLLSFGLIGLSKGLPLTSVDGPHIMGLQSNGLLALISVAAAVLLVGAALRGGRTASTVGIVMGVAFLLSGVANMFVLDTGMNMLAFGLSNVIFSVIVGMGLLFTGAYGRISGGLAPDSPYYHGNSREPDESVLDRRTAAERATDNVIDRELADAERAVALHYATSEQSEAVERAKAFRTPEDRRRAYRSV